jgi:hypothetical protein
MIIRMGNNNNQEPMAIMTKGKRVEISCFYRLYSDRIIGNIIMPASTVRMQQGITVTTMMAEEVRNHTYECLNYDTN